MEDSDSFDKLHPEAQPVSDTIEDSSPDLHETHMDVQKSIRELWINDALKNCCKIMVKNLSFQEIYNLRPPPDIDPYSSLEDVGDTEYNSETQDQKVSTKTGVSASDNQSDLVANDSTVIGTITIKREYNMRTRPSKLPIRPKCSCANPVNYAKLNDPNTDSDSPPLKRQRKTLDFKSEPSDDRIASQKYFKSKNPNLMKPLQRHPIPMLPKSNRNKIESIDLFEMSTDDYTVPEDDIVSTPSSLKKFTSGSRKKPRHRQRTQSPVKPSKKGKLHIEVKGRKKPKSKRKYKCPYSKCLETKHSRTDINDHYKAVHPAVRCSNCGIRFLTPSTLERHSYYHILLLQFPCLHTGCGRLFPFSSDRDRHALVHRTSSDWVCMYPKCGKRFLAKGELTKHAKVHDGIEHECDVCTYRDVDIRNVKAHEWTHRLGTAGHRYFCNLCGQGFT